MVIYKKYPKKVNVIWVQHTIISDLLATDYGFVCFITLIMCYFKPKTFMNHNWYSLMPTNIISYGMWFIAHLFSVIRQLSLAYMKLILKMIHQWNTWYIFAGINHNLTFTRSSLTIRVFYYNRFEYLLAMKTLGKLSVNSLEYSVHITKTNC